MVLVCGPDEIMEIGHKLGGMTVARQQKQKRATLLDDFKSLYGSKPVVIAQMWVGLQITPEE